MKKLLLGIALLFTSNIFCQDFTVQDTVTLNEVVVTGTKIGIARNQIPFTVSQIQQKALEQSGESAVLSAVEEFTPGVFVTKRGVAGFGISTGAAGQINIRGIGGSPTNQVLVLVNGNPEFAGLFGHPLPDTYLSSDVEKVEIIRGPASVLYGSNAMGGVINIITKKEDKQGYSLNGRAMYGTFNTGKFMLNSGYKKDKFDIFASINHDRTDGHRPSSDFKITNGYLKSDYNVNENFNLGADFSLSKTNASDPGQESATEPGIKIDLKRANSNVTLNDEFENVSGSMHLFYNYGENKISDGFSSIDREYGIGVFQSLKLFEGNITTIGFDYKTYGGLANTTFMLKGIGTTHNVNEGAGYALIQQTLINRLVLNAGYRMEHNSVYGYEHVPSAGFAYYVSNNTTIKGSVSKGFRSPTIQELYLFPPANDQLKPERVINYEIGLMQKLFSEKAGVELTLFKANGDNLIRTLVVSGIPQNLNTGEFHNWGVEFAARFNQSNSLNYILNYTYIHQKEPILATPRHSIYLTVNYSVDRFNINFGLQHIGNLITLTNPSVIKENYTLLNSNISYTINPAVSLFLKVENILNEKYQINYDYPMPGITFLGGFNFHL